MLSSAMREGARKQIELKDTSSEGLAFFLDLLYTGSTCSDVDSSVALEALDLAHRWQVGGLIAMVASALKRMITDKNFADIAESAVLKDLTDLKQACATFASKSANVQKNLQQGALPAAVREFLGRPSPSSSNRGAKKRRTF
eukprot:TRINITY_DN50863_c0_g1_i1.p2 TRINITY_DN50863_c0_g1~~TRINITY_DN50863_c0_g1_i1.p2  ORF type:complete len:142 (-),score=31.38 TRINITY_DN50863_c0_g1_i1:1-426(-)